MTTGAHRAKMRGRRSPKLRAWQDGQGAYKLGQSTSKNPYSADKEPLEWGSWRDGWYYARRNEIWERKTLRMKGDYAAWPVQLPRR